MEHIANWGRAALAFVCSLILFPGVAFASAGNDVAITADKPQYEIEAAAASASASPAGRTVSSTRPVSSADTTLIAGNLEDSLDALAKSKAQKANKLLEYDRALIDEIGTQEKTGHTICCPSFSCAYADAVMDGTVHQHDYYTCSCCTWTDWGGGNSSFRCVGSDSELLREAYDQISKGKPTVIHVTGSTSEHWIALIGYENADDPDNLSLANFIALDPWDGKQINAADRYALYGDGCEHISSR